MARRLAVQVSGWVGNDRGLGVLVVNGCLGFRAPGRPNGPPSPRLAPGGFYVAVPRRRERQAITPAEPRAPVPAR